MGPGIFEIVLLVLNTSWGDPPAFQIWSVNGERNNGCYNTNNIDPSPDNKRSYTEVLETNENRDLEELQD